MMTVLGQRWTTWIRDILIGGLIILVVLAWQSRDMLTTDGEVTINNRLLTPLFGNPQYLLTDNQRTLVYFFAPWCQICHLSIGNLEYINSSSVAIRRIALDYHSINEVLAFAEEHNIRKDIFLGNDKLKNEFNVTAYPTYYLLDETGTVIGGSKGYSTAMGLKLRELLVN